MDTVSIKTEYIKLNQVLKLSGILGQGSDIKGIISEGSIKINGQTVYERGKKVRPGDIVCIESIGVCFSVVGE